MHSNARMPNMTRTTIDMKDEHRAILHAISARRGWRGFSRVVEEAIEFYIRQHDASEEARQVLLERRGSWSREEAGKVRDAIAEARQRWTQPSS